MLVLSHLSVWFLALAVSTQAAMMENNFTIGYFAAAPNGHQTEVLGIDDQVPSRRSPVVAVLVPPGGTMIPAGGGPLGAHIQELQHKVDCAAPVEQQRGGGRSTTNSGDDVWSAYGPEGFDTGMVFKTNVGRRLIYCGGLFYCYPW